MHENLVIYLFVHSETFLHGQLCMYWTLALYTHLAEVYPPTGCEGSTPLLVWSGHGAPWVWGLKELQPGTWDQLSLGRLLGPP